jgi:hypothetical protein
MGDITNQIMVLEGGYLKGYWGYFKGGYHLPSCRFDMI